MNVPTVKGRSRLEQAYALSLKTEKEQALQRLLDVFSKCSNSFANAQLQLPARGLIMS